jgi:hypothetical protein
VASQPTQQIDVYIETGQKRTLSGALQWPGWARHGKDEASALQTLFDYAPRYAKVLGSTSLDFTPPASPSAFKIIERHPGNATTDFGGLGAIPDYDYQPVDPDEHERLQAILQACWQTVDAVSRIAHGRELRKGPRGGGRDLPGILAHILNADSAYISKFGWKFKSDPDNDPAVELDRTRQAALDGLDASIRGELPERGPRGGLYWPARCFVRKAAWHMLDHAWEIEDRLV